MSRRGGFSLLFFVIIGCLHSAGCSGTPSNFPAVNLTPNTPQTIGESQALNITAVVANDTSGMGVTWTLNPPTGAGSLTNATMTSVTYSAPATVASATTVTVTATSVGHPAQSATLKITVEPKPAITTTVLPGGTEGAAYTATISASGGVPPFAWSIVSGSLTPGLSLGASNTNSVTISGTPTAQTSSNFTVQVTDSTGAVATQALTIAIAAPAPLAVTTTTLPAGVQGAAYTATKLQASGGVPPFTWTLTSALSTFPPGMALAADGTVSGTPTASGTYTFTVQVTDSETPAKTASGSVSITITNLSVMKGNYAFDFSGFNSTGGVAVAGSFTADGSGNITNGVEDYNSIQGPPKNQTFTGAYTLGGDNRGTLVFSSLAGSPTYAFAIDSAGVHGRLIEFDASGVRGSGQLEKQTVATCVTNTISGNYVFGLAGNVAAVQGVTVAGRIALAGTFLATPGSMGVPGTISNAEMDINSPNTPVLFPPASQSLSGTYQTTSQSARCTFSASPSNLPGATSLNFSVYPVSSTESFLVETDSVQATPYLTVGKLDSQVGYPFNGPTAFSGTSVGGMNGQVLTGGSYLPDESAVWMSSTGGGTFTMSVWENLSGRLITYGVAQNGTPAPFTASYTVDQSGRVSSTLQLPFSPTFYIIDASHSLMIGALGNDPTLGYFDAQSTGPFSATTIQNTFVQGTAAPGASTAQDLSGVISLDGVSVISGTQDQSTGAGNNPGQAVAGSYTGINATYGDGLYTLTSPSAFSGLFLIVSPTKWVMISTTANDTNPVLLIFGH